MHKQPEQNYKWINDSPPSEIIESNPDGSVFIPIGHIETLLTKLDAFWGTENYRFKLIAGHSGAMLADGSLEVVVSYGGRTRRLVGAATLVIPADINLENPYENHNFGATVKSECIKNAVKAIGLAFGAGLNDRLTYTPTDKKPAQNGRKKPDPVQMPVDEAMQRQYNAAVDNGNEKLKTSIEVAYPTIKYTGNAKS